MNIASKQLRPFWIIYIICFAAAMIIIETIASNEVLFEVFKDDPFTIKHLAFVICAFIFGVYLTTCMQIIGPDEIGCVLLVGKPVYQISSGLNIVPQPFYHVQKETKLIIQEKFPGDDSRNPIRIIHGVPESLSDNPLHTQITTPVSIVIRYRIVDLIKFLQVIGNKESLKIQIRDAVVAKTSYEFEKKSLAENLRRREEINDLLKLSLLSFTIDWGIELITVQIENIDTKDIDEDLLKIPKAQFNKRETVIRAEGEGEAEKIKREFIGIGDAKAMELMLIAKASGYKNIAKELKMESGKVLAIIDLVSNALTGAKINLIGTDINDVFKIITAIKNLDINS